MNPTMPADTEMQFNRPAGKVSLWFGVLAAPIAWAVQFQVVYAMTPFLCDHRWLGPLHHAVTLLLLAVAVAGGALAWRDWHRCGGGWPTASEAGVPGRSRFMAVLGMMTAPLFALVIVGQWLASLFLDPCTF